MKKYYLFGGIALVILFLIFFGRGVSHYMERKHLEAMNKGLVTRIMKHNDPDFGRKSKKPVERTTGLDFGLDTTADKTPTEVNGAVVGRGINQMRPGTIPGPNGTMFNNGYAPGSVQNPGQNIGQPTGQYMGRIPSQAAAPGQPARLGQTPPTVQPTPQDDYYPPTVIDRSRQ